MKSGSRSIRTFIGVKDYKLSREFYKTLGFEELDLGVKMCYYKVTETLGFYLQDYYAKEWVENSMVFLEVDDLDTFQQELLSLNLTDKFPNVRISEVCDEKWGREIFMHDPSGVLWHFGEFK